MGCFNVSLGVRLAFTGRLVLLLLLLLLTAVVGPLLPLLALLPGRAGTTDGRRLAEEEEAADEDEMGWTGGKEPAGSEEVVPALGRWDSDAAMADEEAAGGEAATADREALLAGDGTAADMTATMRVKWRKGQRSER